MCIAWCGDRNYTVDDVRVLSVSFNFVIANKRTTGQNTAQLTFRPDENDMTKTYTSKYDNSDDRIRL